MAITAAQWQAVELTLLNALNSASHIGSVALPTGVTITYRNIKDLTDAIDYVQSNIRRLESGGGFYLARMANV